MFAPFYAVLLFLAPLGVSFPAETTVRVVDEEGVAVEEFEIMWHTADRGYSHWNRAQKGSWKGYVDAAEGVVDLIVRGEGFASRVQRYDGESLPTLRDGKAVIVLERGRNVTIEARNLSSPIPADFRMESFFPEFIGRVHTMWQPVNFRGQAKPDWNMLNVKKIDDRRFAVRLSEKTGEFFLAFQHPGWLQFCEFGLFDASKVGADGIQLPMPAPAKIQVTFDPRQPETDRPFKSATCSVYWVPDDSGGMYEITNNGVAIDESGSVTLSDLGPGRYTVDVRTIPKGEPKSDATNKINAGLFHDSETVTLKSGQSTEVAFAWTPFDPKSYRGSANAEIKVVNGNGTVPTGRKITISWYDGHYGALEVFQGTLPESGIVRLDGVAGRKHRRPAPFGPYSISIDTERLGFFELKDTKDLQQLQFAVSPKAGDVAPDIELIAVGPNEHKKLSDYRGQVVLVEFWATWCGPCQPAMQKLSDLSGNMPAAWRDKVSLLGLSTDRDAEKIRAHVASRGWTKMPQFQVLRHEGEYFSEAEKAYVVHGIPHAILIDQQGTVRWRGHPSETTDGKTLNDRIGEVLK